MAETEQIDPAIQAAIEQRAAFDGKGPPKATPETETDAEQIARLKAELEQSQRNCTILFQRLQKLNVQLGYEIAENNRRMGL